MRHWGRFSSTMWWETFCRWFFYQGNLDSCWAYATCCMSSVCMLAKTSFQFLKKLLSFCKQLCNLHIYFESSHWRWWFTQFLTSNNINKWWKTGENADSATQSTWIRYYGNEAIQRWCLEESLTKIYPDKLSKDANCCSKDWKPLK